jgi:hypothetical protein
MFSKFSASMIPKKKGTALAMPTARDGNAEILFRKNDGFRL